MTQLASRFEVQSPTGLLPVEAATDRHQAAGLWWAQAILNQSLEVTAQRLAHGAPEDTNFLLLPTLQPFSAVLTDISRTHDIKQLKVGLHPDAALTVAAHTVGIPLLDEALFPKHTLTVYENDQLMAQTASAADFEPIWSSAI